MSSYIEISSDDLNTTNLPLNSSPKDNNLNLNESSELDFPSFGEYGIPNPAILFANKKTGIRPDTEIVDLISPSKPLSPLNSSSSVLIPGQHDCVFHEISSSPPLDQEDNEEFENHSFANWDDMISEIPSINDLSPRSINLDNIFNETHNLDTLYSHVSNCDETINNEHNPNDISQQVITWDGINNEIPSLSDLSFHDINCNEINNSISSLQEISPQSIRWDGMVNEDTSFEDAFFQDKDLNDFASEHSFLNDLLPQATRKTSLFNHISNLNNTPSKVLKSKETIVKLNKARPVTEDACKQLFIKHSKDWVEENNDLGLSILNSIKTLDIDLIPSNETKIPWCLEYFMVQNFEINKNDGIFYPVSEDQYKITPMNKILLKWNAKEIIEDLENFNWSPSKMSMSISYSCSHEKSIYMLYPKSVTAFITSYAEVISNLQKNSKKTFEQQMAAFSQTFSNDPNSAHADEHQHLSKDRNSEKIQHLEQFLNYIEIKYSMNLVYIDDANDIANYTKLFSSTVAEIPFRTDSNQQRQKLNLEQLQSKKIPSVSDLSNSQNYFYKQLQQIPGVAPLTARTIVINYPSPKHLIKAYQSTSTDAEKLSLISNLSISGDSLSQNNRTRNVGNSVAQKLLKIFYCSNGSETIL